MKALGYLLITAGFLVGSVFAVQTAENEVQWSGFVPAFVVGIIGVVLARVGSHREASHEGKLSGDFETLTTTIDRIVENVKKLDDEKQSMDPYSVHGRIDELLRDDLSDFAEARESVGYLHTLADYAEVMNAFAAGERYINRVWSASIDGWVDELQEYLGRAREQFVAVQTTLHTLQQRPGG
jgi:hypothetical protein